MSQRNIWSHVWSHIQPSSYNNSSFPNSVSSASSLNNTSRYLQENLSNSISWTW